MALIVQKFGGTSVGSVERIKNVAKIVHSYIQNQDQVVVVASAMAGVTSSLVSSCLEHSLLDNIDSLSESDAAIATGETASCAMIALELQNLGLKAKSLQGWQVPIETNGNHGNAQVLNIPADRIRSLLAKGITPVITGFQGVFDSCNVTTLGRGGSDTTAALIAAAINADRCDIFTDVDGIYSGDPRLVPHAHRVEEITLLELYYLCAYGAKILHHRAALAALKYGFALRIVSSFIECPVGTIAIKDRGKMESRQITAITSNKNLLKITIEKPKNIQIILDSLAQIGVSLSKIELFPDRVLLLANLSDKNKASKILVELEADKNIAGYILDTNIASVSLVGYGIKDDISFIAQIMNLLDSNNIKIYKVDIQDIYCSFLLDDTQAEKTVKLLHPYTAPLA